MFVIATVAAFPIAFPTLAERVKAVATLESFAILLGQPYHAETLGGFTQWRVTTAIALIGAIWGLLTATGLLRGEEDAGRWEVLLAGPVTKARATAETLLGLGGSLAVMLAVTAVGTLASLRLPGVHYTAPEAIAFAATLVAGAAMFAAIGALVSQLSATRGQAATLAAGVMGAAFLVRMVADSKKGWDWLLWLTPFGWIEKVRPLRDMDPLAFVPIVALVAICVVATLELAAVRDLGASVLSERDGSGRIGGWVIGPTTLALRLVRGTSIAWIVGIAVFGFFTGTVTRSATALLADSPTFAQVLGKLGFRGASEAYLGVSFFMAVLLLAVMAAGMMASTRDEEASGRLDNLIVRPTPRILWLAGRTAIACVAVLLGGIAAGIATWAGAESQHVGIPFEKMLDAGVNATAPAIFVIGAGVLVLGVGPRLVSAVAYGIPAYSFIVELVGSLVKGQDWIRDTSLLHHVELAPAVKPDWGEDLALVAIAAAMAAVGAVAFRLRDVEYA
ncbi:MAG: ABC transporter permease subunit [Chloroflexota bacterium]|nr:ABC transporter permease subunit [Chloroflexota bacterium]